MRWVLGLGLMGGLGLAGCGDEKAPAGTVEDDTARTPDLTKATDALLPIVEAFCKQAFRCCTDGEIALDFGAAVDDVKSCQDALLSSGFDWYATRTAVPGLAALRYVGHDFARGSVSIDEEAVTACAESVEKSACREQADVCEPSSPEPDSPCDDIFVGMREEGEECGVGQHFECAEGLYCQSLGGNSAVCAPQLGKGETCNLGGQCADDLLCDPQRDVCTEGLAEGEACEFVDPEDPQPGTEKKACASGLGCDTEKLVCADADCRAGMGCNDDTACPEGLSCVYGQCGELRENGEHCWEDADCESGTCDWDALESASVCGGGGYGNGATCSWEGECKSKVCDYATSTCVAPRQNGESCEQIGTLGCADGICEYDATAGENLCVAGGKQGADCGGDYQCVGREQFECIDGKCRKTPLPAGATCEAASQCESEQCVEGECVALGEMGDDCNPDGSLACAEAFYCDANDKGEGSCKELKAAGDRCDDDRQCENGNCRVTAGMKICNSSRPVLYCTGR